MIKNATILSAIYMIQDYHKGTHFLEETVDRVLTELNLLDKELEALQQPKSCDGCWYGKTTINSVICGKNGTYKEADDYCKYYNPKEQ